MLKKLSNNNNIHQICLVSHKINRMFQIQQISPNKKIQRIHKKLRVNNNIHQTCLVSHK